MKSDPKSDLADLRYVDDAEREPDAIAKLLEKNRQLREVWLPDTEAGEAISLLQAVPKLERVRLGEVSLDHLKKLAKHADRISGLTLGAYEIVDKDLALLKPFTRLRQLGLRLIQMTEKGLASLSEMGELEDLEIVQAQLWGTGLSALPAPQKLRRLEMKELMAASPAAKEGAPLEALQTIARFTNLEEAWFSYRFTKKGFAALAPLTNLRTLHTFACAIDDAGLAAALPGMTRLEHLGLWGSPVSDKGLAGLAGAKGLVELSVEKTRIGDATLALLAGLPALAELDLAATQVTQAGVAKLAPLKKLRKLALANPDIGEDWLAALQKLQGLEKLAIARGTLSAKFFQGLAKLPKLVDLDLSRSVVTDAEVPAIAKLTKLKRVVLSGTKVKRKGLQALQAALPDCFVPGA